MSTICDHHADANGNANRGSNCILLLSLSYFKPPQPLPPARQSPPLPPPTPCRIQFDTAQEHAADMREKLKELGNEVALRSHDREWLQGLKAPSRFIHLYSIEDLRTWAELKTVFSIIDENSAEGASF
ncbi:MAG TPA: hypothetical protein VGJ20_08895 [Xanthobacteraceae bacterium]